MIWNVDGFKQVLFNLRMSGPTWHEQSIMNHEQSIKTMVGSNIGTEGMEISSGPTVFVAADSAKQLTCADARVESHQTVNSHLLRLPCHLAQTFSARSLKWNRPISMEQQMICSYAYTRTVM